MIARALPHGFAQVPIAVVSLAGAQLERLCFAKEGRQDGARKARLADWPYV